jgi:hypothetical protein
MRTAVNVQVLSQLQNKQFCKWKCRSSIFEMVVIASLKWDCRVIDIHLDDDSAGLSGLPAVLRFLLFLYFLWAVFSLESAVVVMEANCTAFCCKAM